MIYAVQEAVLEGANFTGLTIWGIKDNPQLKERDYSYKMNGPYCGLYDNDLQPKESYYEVYNALK